MAQARREQHVGDDLTLAGVQRIRHSPRRGGVRGVGRLHARHHVGVEDAVLLRVGLHVHGEQLGAPVVVDVSHVETHRVARDRRKRHRRLPAIRAPQPDAVGQGEVVARVNIQPAVAIQIDQQQRQCL